RYSSVAGQYQSAMSDGRRDAHDARLALVGAAGTAVVAAVFFVLDGLHPAEATRDFGAPPAAAPPPAPALGDSESARAAKADEDGGWTRYNITAMTATGVTVILLGTAAFFGAEASSKESDVNRLLTNRDEVTGAPVRYSSVAGQYQSAMSDGRSDAHDARLALVGAAGTAVVAAVFFVLDGLHPAEAKVALAPTSSGAVGALAWSF
ncbi:MAG TPA: hypothetical protein VK989_03085, partial [Polyangia bacterium]|nr:hypothetical protein [Polyangia bacterium]